MPTEYVVLDPTKVDDLWEYFDGNGWVALFTPPAAKRKKAEWTSPTVWSGELTKCVERLKASAAGQEICTRMEARVPKINVLAVPGVASCFICAEEFETRGLDALAKKYAPLVAIDPAMPFAYLAVTLKPGEEAKADPAPASAAVAVMPPWMVLGHELGHVCQWAHSYSWYCAKLSGGVADIESDNLTSHEQPLCEEAGLPKRRAYKDFLAADSKIGSYPFASVRAAALSGSVAAAFTKMKDQGTLITPSWGARRVLGEINTMLKGLVPLPSPMNSKKTTHFGYNQFMEYYNCCVVTQIITLLEAASPKSTLNPNAPEFVPRVKLI